MVMILRQLTKILNSVVLALAVFAIGYLMSSVAYAQEGAGVSISPALIEEGLEPGEVKNYSFTIRNLTSVAETYFLFTRNIEGMAEDGIPAYAEEGEETGFGLADWITLDTNQITLAPNEEGEVSFSLNVPSNASPGSHFGGVFVSKDAPEIRRSGAAVGYRVGNIISIRVAGDAVLNATIRQFSTDRYLHGSSNVDFSVRVENEGNVLIRPTGPIEITNMLGQTVDTVTFNEQRGAVFPESLREYTQSWAGQGTGFGRYEATIALSYGEQGTVRTMSSTVTFWILPMNIILPALGVLATLLLVTYVFVKLYIRRALAQAGYSSSRARRQRRGGNSTGLLLLIVLLAVTALFLLVMLLLFA